MTDPAKQDDPSNAVLSTAGLGGWIVDVEIGDKLMPIPLWNKTERRPNQLHMPTEILDIVTGKCQSGFLFLVRKINTSLEWLDAEWFEPPNVKGNAPATALQEKP